MSEEEKKVNPGASYRKAAKKAIGYEEGLNKAIVFTTNDKKQAEFLVRLHYDGFTQSNFFRLVLNAYMESDSELMPFIDKIKPMAKERKRKSKKLRETGEQLVRDFALNAGEIENIFDILEQEFPDL